MSWTEYETNPRPAPVAANRVATYADPFGIEVRFLHALHLSSDRTRDGDPTLALTNIAHVALSPTVAKRFLVDLQNAVDQYEAVFGPIADIQSLAEKWNLVHAWNAASAPESATGGAEPSAGLPTEP